MRAGLLERAARALLGLYSASFRSQLGEDMVGTFLSEAASRGERSRLRGAAYALHGLGAMVVAAVLDRTRERRSEMRRSGSRSVRSDGLGMVVRGVARRIVRTPGLSLGVVVLFALGIGANTTMYGAIDGLLLRPPAHLADPSSLRIVAVEWYSRALGRTVTNPIHSYPEFMDWQGAASLSGIAGYNYAVSELTVGRGESAVRVPGLSVTGDYFGVLGVSAELGRTLGPADDAAGAEPVVVISDGLWRRMYGGSRDVLDRSVDFGRGPHRIVGVLPRGFTGTELTPVDVWYALAPYRAAIQGPEWWTHRGNDWLEVVVRIRPGVTAAAAEAELTARSRSASTALAEAVAFPEDGRVLATSLIPGESPLAGPEVNVARWLAAVSLIVLLVASINVANLFLARAARSLREIAIRRALGVTRRRLIAESVLETAMLATAGGTAALVIARYCGSLLLRGLLPGVVERSGTDLIAGAGATLLLTAGACLLASLLPVLWLGRLWSRPLLSASSGGIARSNATVRASLVAMQVALSAVLLAGSGLFLRSFHRAASSDLGIDLERAYYLTVETDSIADLATFYEEAVRTLGAVPGVEAASASSTVPFFNRHGVRFRMEGLDTVPPRVMVHVTAGAYFAATGLEVLRGRVPRPSDDASSEPVAAVNREMAAVWGGDVLGRCLYVGDGSTRCTRVVGVVEDAIVDGVGGRALPQFYLVASQQRDVPQLWGFPVRVRREADPTAAIEGMRAVLYATSPRIRWVDVTPFEEMLRGQMRPWRLGATLFTAFGVLALVVAGIGLFGLVTFDVVQRTRELGLRAALGAGPARLVGMVVRRSFTLAATGLVPGVAVILLLSPRLSSLLYETGPRDPLTVGLVVVVLAVVACLSSVLPAIRASRADPNTALRTEV